MRKRIWTATCAAVVTAAAIVATAQQPPSPPSSGAQTSTPQTAATASADHKVTVTGCLKESAPSPAAATGTSGATGTTGTSGTKTDTTADAMKFVLANASASSADTTSSATTAAGAQTYRLIANEAALRPHVGKKLELTGTLEGSPSASAEPATTTASASGPALKVESGKVLSTPCTE
jgi:hypothetical protein